ncbi:MAG: cytochrome P450 [Streptomycetaceae bacterium]|nr:cytochrome P450 [Streptomycetaceae bacterium]
MAIGDASLLDPARLHELFDLRSEVYASKGGAFDTDPYPAFARLRETGPVHEGVVGPLVGYHGEAYFQGLPYPDRPHYSAFDFATCDEVVRNPDVYSSSPTLPGEEPGLYETSMLCMDGRQHRDYRALVQPSFLPRRMRWWVERWIDSTVHSLIDVFADRGRCDLNVEFFAPIPLLTICGSFGVSVGQALDIREVVAKGSAEGGRVFAEIVLPLIRERRGAPGDDLISVLVQAELHDEDGDERVHHTLPDEEVLAFAFLLLAAGSGTTWKQMGITMLTLLERPELLDAVRRDRALLRPVVEEVLRWMPTDPVFARFTTRDTTLGGVDIPAGSVVHVCFGAANRDPERWERPDAFDPHRATRSHLGFGGGPHVCLGMHVARTEIATAVGALLDRLPDLRLDPDAPPPTITGMYERGPTAVPVVFG